MAARTLEILRLTLPLAGAVLEIPLKLMLLPETWPAIAVGTKPLPRSTETTASRVWLLASTRLVTLTGRSSVKLPLNTVPGTEPEHCRTISPRRSVRPSARTWTGEVVTWHRAVEEGGWANAAQMPICRRQTFKTVRLRFVISRLGWSYYPLYPAIWSENPGPPDWPFWLCAGIRGTPRRLCPWHELSRFPKTVRHPRSEERRVGKECRSR